MLFSKPSLMHYRIKYLAQKVTQQFLKALKCRVIYSNLSIDLTNVGVYDDVSIFCILTFESKIVNLQGDKPADHDPNMWVI